MFSREFPILSSFPKGSKMFQFILFSAWVFSPSWVFINGIYKHNNSYHCYIALEILGFLHSMYYLFTKVDCYMNTNDCHSHFFMDTPWVINSNRLIYGIIPSVLILGWGYNPFIPLLILPEETILCWILMVIIIVWLVYIAFGYPFLSLFP